MKKKTRLILLLICLALFFVIAPILAFYSMGYRFDFEKKEIVATGGIYVRTFPSAEQIIINSEIFKKPGLFTNFVFVQNLLPKEHSVLIKKDGYFDYNKTLPVKENQVTKIENILLIKQDIEFSKLATATNYFSFSPNNKNILLEAPATKTLGFEYFEVSSPEQKKTFLLSSKTAQILDIKWSEDSNKALINIQNGSIISYYLFNASATIQQTTPLSFLNKNSKQISFNPQDSSQIFYIENKTLYSFKTGKPTSLIKNAIAYKINNEKIFWLSLDGFLNQSDISGKLISKLTQEKIPLDLSQNYEIIEILGKIFLKNSENLLAYNSSSKTWDVLETPITNYKTLLSPDGKNMLYYNNKDIYIHSFEKNLSPLESNIKLFSANSPKIISECFWLNNDYIIFESGNKIIISEIDYRGNINAVVLPENYELSTNSKNPQIFFNSADSKVYILRGNNLFSSEKLIP